LVFVVILGRRGRVLMKLYRVASASALVPSLHRAKMILIYLNKIPKGVGMGTPAATQQTLPSHLAI